MRVILHVTCLSETPLWRLSKLLVGPDNPHLSYRDFYILRGYEARLKNAYLKLIVIL